MRCVQACESPGAAGGSPGLSRGHPHWEPVPSGFKYLGKVSCAPSDGPQEHRLSTTGPPGKSPSNMLMEEDKTELLSALLSLSDVSHSLA